MTHAKPFRAVWLPALVLLGLTSGVHPAVAVEATVDANSPSVVIAPGTPNAVIPITITRTDNTPVSGISVTFQLSNLDFASSSLGGFLGASGGNPSGPFVTSNGGGSYTLDAATLGAPCGSSALSGVLFNVTVGSSATNGTGTLTITQVKLRDCSNAPIASAIGLAASVDIDRTGPAITSCAANQAGAAGAACQAAVPDFTSGVVASDPHGPITVTQSPTAGTLVGVGATLVTLTVSDHVGNSSTCTATFMVSDLAPPVVTLTSPNGGETWIIGTSRSVSWTGSDNCGLATFDLELSTNGGASYAPIVSGQPYASGFSWTVPNAPTTQARLRVTLHDAAGNAAGDASDANFTIRPSNLPPSLSPIGDRVTDELVPMTFTAAATDPDAGQTLTFSLDLGAPAGASIVPSTGVFTWTPTEDQGPGEYGVTVRVTDNGTPVLDAFETLTITVNEVDLAAVTLTAAPVLSGNDGDGTTKIRLTWTPQASGTSVTIYRHGFGSYPQYDDLGGAEPPAPTSFPPGSGWNPVATVSGSSVDDEVAWPARDFWYYVAYVQGPGANVSPPSNRTDGTLNYKLGDIRNPFRPPAENGHGDNLVNSSDVTLLGAHYGLTGSSVAPYAYMDVGPTSTGYVNGRPLTDHQIDFEDLILFSINFDVPSGLMTSGGAPLAARPMAAGDLTDHVTVEAPTSVQSGATFTVRVRMTGSGAVQGLSASLQWDETIAQPVSAVAGSWLTSQSGVMFSPRPGTVDAVLLGVHASGLTGDGYVAELTFLASASGDPHVRLSGLKARDALNQPLLPAPLDVQQRPQSTTLLSAPAPNPFRTTAQFTVSLPESGPMELAVYSVDGRRVRTLASGARNAGEYRLTWDGRGDSGQNLEAGVYFARLETHHGRCVRTIALLK